MPDVTFGIRDWYAWKPGRENREEWRAWGNPAKTTDTMEGENSLTPLPMMVRRRITGFGQKVLESALATQAAERARYIFATRHGEFVTTLRILDAICDGSAPSPADFSMSVHHALAGLLSIHTGNKAGHTTISAGADSFGYGMLEAVATLDDSPEQSTFLVCYDDALPGAYGCFRDRHEDELPLIVALDIVEADTNPAQRFALSVAPKDGGDELPRVQEVPMAQQFLSFLLRDQQQVRIVGGSMIWNFRRVG
jgi:hypothetical protein